MGSVLGHGVDQLTRRGFDRGYLALTEELPGIRGKLEVSNTIGSNCHAYARTICSLDEISPNVLHNQIIKATLRRLLLLGQLDEKLREQLRITCLGLPAISDIKLKERDFRVVQLHGNLRFYRFLLDVCWLLFECMIPDQAAGRYRFRDFTRDENRMSVLFERFLFNFCRHEQREYKVTRPVFPWANAIGPRMSLLPRMRTDICLTSGDRCIVLDAKYTASVLQEHHGHRSLRSAHLYQLFSYLKNIPVPASDPIIGGMLLYPLAADYIDTSFSIHGHEIRVVTMNLNQHWKGIRRELLDLLESQRRLKSAEKASG